MKILYATFTAKPGCEEQLAALVAELTAQVRAEPGNLEFVAYTLAHDPRQYLVMERYADGDAFEAHLSSAHCQAFNAAIVDLVEGGESTLYWLEEAAG